jgi:hypothetical protein
MAFGIHVLPQSLSKLYVPCFTSFANVDFKQCREEASSTKDKKAGTSLKFQNHASR